MKLPFQNVVIAACILACIESTARAEPQVVKYKASIKGAGDSAVEKEIKSSALTFTLLKRPPSTIGQLQHRVDKALPRIEKILESRGYYDGTVAADINTSRDPVRVVFNIDPGRQYRFGNIKIRFGNNDPELKKITPRLRKNARVIAARVFEEETRILELVQREGYPFPALEKRVVHVDRNRGVVDLEMSFDPGVFATYGGIEVTGLETLKPIYIQRQLPWKKGERFDAKLVSDFENKLLSTGLFGTARVEPQSPINGSNAIPVKIALTERALRTLRLGVGYSDVGPNGKAIWEHRNLFGGGENLETSLIYSPIEINAKATLERPGFLLSNQSLILDADGSRETPEAYEADKLTTGVLVKRDFTRHIMAGTGLRYKYSKVEQLQEIEIYNQLIFPLLLNVDYRNDKLNPVNGAQLFATPSYYKDLNASDSFLKTGLETRLYKMLWERPRLSGATRLTLGWIEGASTEYVPADERYYAGGGGSIRGYEYQSVGPQLDGTPLGGSQLMEFSVELRMQPGNKLGYVAFVDGGTAYNDLVVDADRSLRYGAGFGLRWFTGIGPLRADLAYPLNPASDQVERLQFYISLGQAF